MDELVKKWRDDTPGCANQIHFNNAGAGLMPRGVLDAIVRHGVLASGIAFLSKPFTPDALALKVRELLDGMGAGASVAPGGPRSR